jgi:uncharacterized protein with ATP-grasp and redox domains
MKTCLECIPCFIRQAEEAMTLGGTDLALREPILKKILRALAEADWGASPPAVARDLHRIIRKETDNLDPYREIKKRMNSIALDAMPSCQEYIRNHAAPREAAVRAAIAGNLLDSGAKIRIHPEDLPKMLAELLEKPLSGDPLDLFREIEKADRILYLADNAGEIVFDRLLLDFLPTAKVTLAVRGHPILNDALREDAELAGFNGLVPVIDNGSDAPGTVLEDCSAAFRECFYASDLIMSKGQGNYETLSSVPAPIFFLFTVKCPMIASQVGAPVGTMIAKKSACWTSRPDAAHPPS